MTSHTESNPNTPTTHRQRLERYIDRIERYDGRINAVMEVVAESARAGADEADAAERRGESLGPLHGTIIALKDNVDTAGIRTTSGSRLFEEYTPKEDASVYCRMRNAGAILIAKLGLHECVFGPTSQNQWFGRIRNPWNTEHIPGGSSGGSGAAVAAEFCDLALGTDTGGSVRIPSAMCGVTGLRPTQGAVSNHGVRPISPHLDTVGPLARSVVEVAQAFNVMRGFDSDDETSRSAPPYAPEADRSVSGLRVGIPRQFFGDNLEPAVATAYDEAKNVFSELGAIIVPIDLPDAARAARVTPRIVVADAADYYGEAIQNRPEAIGEEVMRRMRLGFDVTGVEYANNMRFMYHWRNQLRRCFAEQVDVILTPTLSIAAPRILESDDLLNVVDRITPFTMAWALGAVPTLAVPAGLSDAGLPVSVQLAAGEFNEALLFRAGGAFQAATSHHLQRPPL